MINLDTTKLIALKLSTLNNSDFDWVYSQLTQDIKDDLDPIIREIREIGFEVDGDTMSMLVKNNIVAPEGVEDKNIEVIKNSTLHEVTELFRHESPVLFDTLYSMQNWTWKKDLKEMDLSKHLSSKVIKNINSKTLLKKSLISTTAIFLKNGEIKQAEKDIGKFKLGKHKAIYKYIFRFKQQWKF